MKNQYAKEYYDTYLKGLTGEYKAARWFSSPAALLDYVQTRRTLKNALQSVNAQQTLEIGPGDGVWTDLVLPKADQMTLLDQSIEMITRAKDRLKDFSNITYVNQDFLTFTSDKKFSLIFAIRCFEYFEDKQKAVQKFSTLLETGGKLVIVTKNPDHARTAEAQKKELHGGQISRSDMSTLLENNGFALEKCLSATWRFKAKHIVFRALFNIFHSLHVVSGGFFVLPFATKKLTESYIYVAKKL